MGFDITLVLIIITVAVSIAAFQSEDLRNRLLMNPYVVKHDRQWYRFISSGFIHANWTHLLFNIIVFYSFSSIVKYYYDAHFGMRATWYFLILYLGGMIISDLPTYIRHQNHPWYNSLGASGAVSAVLFAFIFFDPLGTIYFYFLPMPGIVMGILYLGYSWYMAKQGGDNINHDAHFYGAVFGIVYTFLLKPSLGLDFFHKLLQFS
ncbi:MAG: rhomboid family intramembrane serine protease [Chitinophagales bacterium]|nr:rhomboid family intramembrane serine protease [Chitinophagales bacterium]